MRRPPSSSGWLPRFGLLLAAALVLLVLLGQYIRSSSGDSQQLPSAALCTWSPYLLPVEDQRFALDLARLPVPSYVGVHRRLLTAQLALGALRSGVPGDFVETGVLFGGTSILMLKALERVDPNATRQFWAADSFKGLPEPVDQDKNGPLLTGEAGTFSYPRDAFMSNLRNASISLLDSRLNVLEGWFNETLPTAPIKSIAFLRLDGDLYVSTKDPLDALYDRVSPGGLIYIDDYGSFTGCRRAVDEFRAARGITAPLMLQGLPESGVEAPETAQGGSHEYRWEAAWWIKPPCSPPLMEQAS